MSKVLTLVLKCVVLFPFFSMMGCDNSSQPAGARDSNVVGIASGDPELIASVEAARQSLGEFIQAFENPKPVQFGFAIKKGFEDGDEMEHMWVEVTGYENQHFHGTISNQPEFVTNVRLGDQVRVPRSEIDDWMFVDNDRLRGGYSIRLIRNRMPPDERAQFDAEMGIKIE